MAYQEVLIMAMTRMKAGICTAGFITEPHPTSHWQWVRPIKTFGCLLLGDMSTANCRIVQVGDVVQLNLLKVQPAPPRREDWVADFVKQRLQVMRQLTDQKRADFLTAYSDQTPEEVLQQPMRSLCLISPQEIWARFVLDKFADKYTAFIGFQLHGVCYPATNPMQGMAVTDLKWRALGRSWLAETGETTLHLEHTELLARLHADVIHLCIGLSHPFNGKVWPLVVGVHAIPDYRVEIDYANL